MTYTIKVIVTYKKVDPLNVSCVVSNPNNLDLYYGMHFSPFDPMGNRWIITNDKSKKKADYAGIMVKRRADTYIESNWILIKSGGSSQENMKLEFDLPKDGGDEFTLSFKEKTIRVTTEKIFEGGKLVSKVHRANLELSFIGE